MSIQNPFKKLFARKKTLADLSSDELRRERIRLEQEEKRYARRVGEIEEEKKSLFMQGTNETSKRKLTILARRIKEKEAEAKNVERNLTFFSRQLRIVNGFIQLKENERIIKESGVSSLISNVDLQDLQVYVDQATVDGMFSMDKFGDILSTLERSEDGLNEIEEDAEIAQLVQAMQAARDSRDLDPEAPERLFEEVSSKQVDKEEEEEDF